MTPPVPAEPGFVIAACRAGARGILNLEYADSLPAARASLEFVVKHCSGGFGVRLGVSELEIAPELVDYGISCVIFAGGDTEYAADWITRFQGRGVAAYWEATCIEEMEAGYRLGVNGLILKGNEAGGRVGEETTFVLLQHWRAGFGPATDRFLPAWVQGGIGLNTAAASIAAGAAGVVLDDQLLLAKESSLRETGKSWLLAFDGSQTQCLGEGLGETYRVYKCPGSSSAETLQAEASSLKASELAPHERRAAWHKAVETELKNTAADEVLFLGQSACFAANLAERYVTVAGILQALADRVERSLETARQIQPLARASDFAKRHGIEYPIFQGPMTRVSDTAAFADSVSRAGALPFLALALLQKKATEALLAETKERLGERAWGAGLLGFLPPEIRKNQIEAIRRFKPPYALIAGGRPDQARELEAEGIPTYLHVPSPGLLKMFLKDGARRFIFEGRECGGHVGPRGSFVLWESMCELLLDYIQSGGKAQELHIVFAGGIHDGVSCAAVSALAAPLAEKGAAVGVLMGTAYLFTKEAVEGGAIVPRFQQEAINSQSTVLMETAPGHAIRCINTPYFETFLREKQKLQREGKSNEEITQALEWMNIGRLRVAAKGLDRAQTDSGQSELAHVADDEQFSRGMYMIGQVAVMRDRVINMENLHQEVCAGGTTLLAQLPAEAVAMEPDGKPCDIAVIGMSCFYPKARSLSEYWENILNRVDAVTEVPETHWDWRLYYDSDPRAKDKIVSKWGGFMEDIPFDPLQYGITPASVKAIEPLQLLLLEAVQHTIKDAGYAQRPFNREKTCAILGIGGGGGPLAVSYGFRCCLPLLNTVPGVQIPTETILEAGGSAFPEWTEDSFPGILSNVAVGRVANRFNFGGANLAIDAACASSLAAVYSCVRELEMGTSDVAIAMGADTVMTPYAYTAFSKTYALSQRGRCSPFDAAGDGIVLSEGIGAVMLKRLADAERDGDKVYAVIKGVGASSDGREKGLTAPNLAGQMRALRRAYQQANLSPSRVELIEAHGTGTVVGDHTEAQALIEVFNQSGANPQSCAIGSVKSMIGHTKCAAGIGGMIKTALALHHKVLPPTLVEQPNPRIDFEESPLYLNSEARPWVHGAAHPRYAGVSAFGFGGTNYHIVMEEYTGTYQGRTPPAQRAWPAELLVWRRQSRQQLTADIERLFKILGGGPRPDLARLAMSVNRSNPDDTGFPTLAVVASDTDDLRLKLAEGLQWLRSEAGERTDPRGIYFRQSPKSHTGKVAFMFPGQGSQYPNMLAQLGVMFPEVREAFDRATRQLDGKWDRPLARFIYPASTFTPAADQSTRETLARTDVAQPALGAAGMGMYRLMESLCVVPDFLAGHSYGEYVALCAAGVLSEDDLFHVSYERGRLINEATAENQGGMVAVDADAETVTEATKGLDDVWLANLNAPGQTVFSGTEAGISALLKRLAETELRGRRIPVACGFHSPLVAEAARPFARLLAKTKLSAPTRTVFSNSLGTRYPAEPDQIGKVLADHMTSPVRFQPELEAMADAGAAIFVELGPQSVLTGLAHQVLENRPHLAVATDVKGRNGLVQLQHALAQLLVYGVPVRLQRLYEDRELSAYQLENIEQEIRPTPLPPTTWMVNGIRCRPLNAPEPFLLGQVMNQDGRTANARSAPSTQTAVTDGPAAQSFTGAAPASSTPHPAGSNSGDQNASLLGASDPVLTPMPNDDVTQVMEGFQNLMSRFLDTQRNVMMTYLQSGAPAAGDNPQASSVNPNSHQETWDRTPSTPGSLPQPAPTPASKAEPANEADSGTETAATPAASPAVTRESLSRQLLELVSVRTGYPPEMLRMDLDLEGELGIDSIKRVEILGSLSESLGTDDGMDSPVELEQLTALRTLGGIVDYLERALDESSPAAAQLANSRLVGSNGAPISVKSDAELEIRRGLVEVVELPKPGGTSILIPAGSVILTDDGRGLAIEIAGRLADLEVSTMLVDPNQIDLCSAEAVGELLARIRNEQGAVGGFIHLSPLAELHSDDTWQDRAHRDVKSLYLFARGLESDLRVAGKNGGAFLLAPTLMGGKLAFGEAALPDPFLPGYGGIAGFTKCLGAEWPEVLVRAVDFDDVSSPPQVAQLLLNELSEAAGPLEVGYAESRRYTWEPVNEELDGNRPGIVLDQNSTVLVTGGARGITARIALELASRHRPRLVLVGRSAEPEAENADTRDLTGQAEIKAALISRLEKAGESFTPAKVEELYQRLMRDREILSNLKALRETGGTVIYRQVDVRNESEMAALLEEFPPDGVIHGAGIIDDKLIKDKTPESFDRVFGTKVDSAAILSLHLDPARVKFLALFASIASRYGNRGQSDYAAANEVLSKLAHSLNRQWPGRVFAVAWGPWAEVGMVSHLEEHLVKRGLKLIAPEQGATRFADELEHGSKGDAEVLIAGGEEHGIRPKRSGQRQEQPAPSPAADAH